LTGWIADFPRLANAAGMKLLMSLFSAVSRLDPMGKAITSLSPLRYYRSSSDNTTRQQQHAAGHFSLSSAGIRPLCGFRSANSKLKSTQ
jgi:hypothetical protein